MDEDFVPGECCERCKGPLLAKPVKKQTYVEETMDYIEQSVWVCYGCGKEKVLQSEPYFLV